MPTLTKKSKKPRRNLTEEERREIQAENTPERRENGQLLPGHSGNPAGRPKKDHTIVDIFRDHNDAQGIINKMFKVANTIDSDSPHPSAMSSLKLIVERLIPSLKASEMKIDTDGDTPFVLMPQPEEPDRED